MKDKMKKITTLITVFVIAFTALPAMGGNLDVHAAGAKAPVQVRNLKAAKVTQTSVKLSWSKVAKNRSTKGYAIYRNGKLIKRVSFKSNTFIDTRLKAKTKYSYTVRAYNTYKQKQFYNSKTRKWQNKRPSAKQWKGKKTRNITAYRYGKASSLLRVTTKSKSAAKATKKATQTVSNSSSTCGNTYKTKGTNAGSSQIAVSQSVNNSYNPAEKVDNNSGNDNQEDKLPEVETSSISFYTKYYGATYPGEDAIDCKKSIRYDENGNDLVENSYFVLKAYLYPNYGTNTDKPVQWTIKENTIGATTEIKGRNLIIKTPKYTSRDQFNGKLVISMTAGGFTEEMEFEPIFPMEIVEYNALLNYKMTPDMKRVFLWGDFGGAYSNEMKATVKNLTAGCTTDRQKVEAILTWFKRNVEYKNDGSSSYTLRGTWRNRYGVCAGQAGLLAQMLRYADIPAGRYVLETSKNHACTMFWMDGKWYYADPTLCCKGNVSCSVERAYVVINDGDKLGCIVGDWYAGGILKSNFC